MWDIQRVWLAEGGSILGVVRVKLCMAGRKGMKPEVCFVVGLVSFSGTAGVGKKERQGHRGLEFQHFFSFYT